MVSCCKWRSGYRYMESLDAGYQTGIAGHPSSNETAAYNPGWHNEQSWQKLPRAFEEPLEFHLALALPQVQWDKRTVRSHEYDGDGRTQEEWEKIDAKLRRASQENGGSRDFGVTAPVKKNFELAGYPWRLEKAMPSRNMSLRPL
jgi:hypothetical protein